LGDESDYLLEYRPKVSKDLLHLPGADFIERTFINYDRYSAVLRNLSTIFNHGRLSKTAYLSILPADQRIEHTVGVPFATNPIYFDP